MGFFYENILAWMERSVQESSSDINEQLGWAYLALSAIEEVIDKLEMKAQPLSGVAAETTHGRVSED